MRISKVTQGLKILTKYARRNDDTFVESDDDVIICGLVTAVTEITSEEDAQALLKLGWYRDSFAWCIKL